MRRILLTTMAAAAVFATTPQPHAVALPMTAATSALPGGDGLVQQVGGRAHPGGVRPNAALNRHGVTNRTANVNRNVGQNINRNVGHPVNRTVNRNGVNVNRTVVRSPNRSTVGAGGNWVRPARFWWRPGGAVAAGVAIGFVGAATAVSWAGDPPGPDMCWYYTDDSQQQGFWDQCP
jgi:hypothetical protein